RLFRKAIQQGRSERRGESYSLPYVEPLSEARTPLVDFVNSLLGISKIDPARMGLRKKTRARQNRAAGEV
ncbi:MAG: hypothetical protein CCU26_02210, partial [Nitrospira sp. UW-LDO-01]